MTKKTKSEKRRQRIVERKRQEQRRQRLTLLAGAAGVIALVAIIALTTLGSAGPTVAEERLERDPVLGDPNAPVTIIEYGAYGCHACKAWHEARVIEDILAEYDGRVNFIFRDNPIISPAYDRMTAELAQCVFDQGNDLFWQFHDQLYTVARQSVSSQSELIGLAGQVGVDTAALQSCADAGTHRQTVGYDGRRAADLGLNATPAFFVNEQRLFSLSPDNLRQLIDQELAEAGA